MKYRICLILTNILALIALEGALSEGIAQEAQVAFHKEASTGIKGERRCSVEGDKNTAERSAPSKDKANYSIEASTVYICKGSKAYAYHKTRKCRGLNNCQSEIVAVSQSEAERKNFRKKCKICYR